MKPPDSKVISTELGEATVLHLLGKGKSGYSFLAELNGQKVVFKRMHDEPCTYYAFGDNKVRLELRAYRKLSELGLAVPRLLTFDVERGFLIKEYVDGLVADRLDSTDEELEAVIGQLFGMANRLRRCGLNIDYFPANFVVMDGRIHYIDYEVNPYQDEWSLSRWGIYYWANQRGMTEYNKSADWRHINESESSGQPIKEPFEAQVSRWRERYGRYLSSD